MTIAFDDTPTNGGSALSDEFTDFEAIIGSEFNDVMIGNDARNVINGGGGGDALRGGFGSDTMTGGGGNDAFQFITPDEGGDFIRDFISIDGNSDFFHISATGYGRGIWRRAGGLRACRIGPADQRA